MVLSTSVELDLKLKLPVAAVNMAGTGIGLEGEKIITLIVSVLFMKCRRLKIQTFQKNYNRLRCQRSSGIPSRENDPETGPFCFLSEGHFLTLRSSVFSR
jgi:hypothetical protein